MKILVSACLLGSPCKYSGGDNLCLPLLELARNHTLIPLCPEQLGGLPTPRPPAERRNGRIVTQSGGDVTHAYEKGAGEIARLARLLDVKAAILKSRSPACGCGRHLRRQLFSHLNSRKRPCGRSSAGPGHPGLHGGKFPGVPG